MNQASVIPTHGACFACGRQNETGLGLVFKTVGDRIRCRTTLDSKYQGYDGIVHGGILASIADAAMVNLVYRRHGGRPLTCSLEMRYRTPISVGDEIIVEAAVLWTRHRITWASCRITVGERVCAEATASFKVDFKQVNDD